MSQQNDGFDYRPPLRARALNGIYRLVNAVVEWHRLPRPLGAPLPEILKST
ncbi:MAG: hypothetical protein L6R19_21835 [Alphaproteobacteria bacterium]|nr:hypothetical protein [Alphaproteobacteria bacterium]